VAGIFQREPSYAQLIRQLNLLVGEGHWSIESHEFDSKSKVLTVRNLSIELSNNERLRAVRLEIDGLKTKSSGFSADSFSFFGLTFASLGLEETWFEIPKIQIKNLNFQIQPGFTYLTCQMARLEDFSLVLKQKPENEPETVFSISLAESDLFEPVSFSLKPLALIQSGPFSGRGLFVSRQRDNLSVSAHLDSFKISNFSFPANVATVEINRLRLSKRRHDHNRLEATIQNVALRNLHGLNRAWINNLRDFFEILIYPSLSQNINLSQPPKLDQSYVSEPLSEAENRPPFWWKELSFFLANPVSLDFLEIDQLTLAKDQRHLGGFRKIELINPKPFKWSLTADGLDINLASLFYWSMADALKTLPAESDYSAKDSKEKDIATANWLSPHFWLSAFKQADLNVLTASFELEALFEPNGARLITNVPKLTLDGLGEISSSINFSGVGPDGLKALISSDVPDTLGALLSFDRNYGAKPVISQKALLDLTMDRFSIIYSDISLIDRLIISEAKKQNSSARALKTKLSNSLEMLLTIKLDRVLTNVTQVSDTLRLFLTKPKNLELSSTPNPPLSAGTILAAESPSKFLSDLGLTLSVNKAPSIDLSWRPSPNVFDHDYVKDDSDLWPKTR
jgi:hypothetical protein